jgi:enoyl-CoA hydratase/carnithine racemase
VQRFISVERREAVGLVVLNRPEVLNAWHQPMRDEFIAALRMMQDDSAVRAIVLTGAGRRAFGAGQDLNDAERATADNVEEWVAQWARLYSEVRSLTKPTVAALNGLAFGSAFQVALLSDFRIAHPAVRVGLPEIDAGATNIFGPWMIRQMLGFSRAVDFMLTGRLIRAPDCAELFYRIVPEDEVIVEALALAGELARKPAIAMALNKRRLREMTDRSFAECVEAMGRYQRESLALGAPVAKRRENARRP